MDTFQLPVSHNLSIGVINLQRAEQGDKGCSLSWSAGVSRTPSVIKATFVTDTNGMGIVMLGMSTNHFFGTPDVELAITGDVVVVAAAVPSLSTMHLVEHLERQMLVRARGRTVDYK